MAQIKLSRVEFINAINSPGVKDDQYGSREHVLKSTSDPNNRLSSSKHFELWHDGEYVYVRHPNAAEGVVPEKVPMANVLQMKEAATPKSK